MLGSPTTLQFEGGNVATNLLYMFYFQCHLSGANLNYRFMQLTFHYLRALIFLLIIVYHTSCGQSQLVSSPCSINDNPLEMRKKNPLVPRDPL